MNTLFAVTPFVPSADRKVVSTHLPLAWTHSSPLEEQKLLSLLEDLAKMFQPHWDSSRLMPQSDGKHFSWGPQDCGWKKIGVLAPPVAADLHNALEGQRKTKTCNQFFFVFANECLADRGALTLTADAVYDFMAVANQVGIWCGQSHFLLCTSRYFYVTSMTYKHLQ